MYNMPQEFFSDFQVVIGDEAHNFKAKSLTGIMGKMINTQYRFGMTGTLDGAQVHELVLLGLFGKIERIIQTSDLIDSGKLASIDIKIIILKHPKQNAVDRTYPEEIEYIISNSARNKFITNLALSLKGNTLLLYTFVEKHGQILYDMIREKNDPTHSCYFVSGDVDGDERENIRAITDYRNKNTITLSFDNYEILIDENELIPLIDSSQKKANDITENDDVDTNILINKIGASTLKGYVIWTNKN
jgi:superfamily II DNA or RNA helicase